MRCTDKKTTRHVVIDCTADYVIALVASCSLHRGKHSTIHFANHCITLKRHDCCAMIDLFYSYEKLRASDQARV
jgi:hypothetical protein